MNQNWYQFDLLLETTNFEKRVWRKWIVKLGFPKINPIHADQNHIPPWNSLSTCAEDLGAQKIGIKVSPNGNGDSQTGAYVMIIGLCMN
jgi:hypothetical protein